MPNPPRRQQRRYEVTARDIATWHLYTVLNVALAVLSILFAAYIAGHAHTGLTLLWRVPASIGLFGFAIISEIEIVRFWNADGAKKDYMPYGWFSVISEYYYGWRLKRYKRRSM